MKRDELGDLMAFLAVAEERSFTPRRRGWAPRSRRSATRSDGSRSASASGF